MAFWEGAGAGLLSGGLSVLGGLAGSLIGGKGPSQRDLMYEQAKLQRKETEHYAKRQLGWLVQGAKSAGIHPLAALGVPVSSGSVTPVGSSGSGSSLGDGIGLGLERAADAVEAARGEAADKRAAQREAGRIAMAAGANSLREQETRIAEGSARALSELAEARLKIMEARSRSLISQVERQARQPGAPYTWNMSTPLPTDEHGRPYLPAGKGKRIYLDPDSVPANLIQEYVGEPAEWAYAVQQITNSLAMSLGMGAGPKSRGSNRPQRFVDEMTVSP